MQLTENSVEQSNITSETTGNSTQMMDSQDNARLGVEIGGKSVLLNMTDVSEVLPVPALQAVPLTKHWYLGVANVRGNLYSVTDLALFLGWQSTPRTASSRIVLINSVKTSQAAILIDAVIGLRHLTAMQPLATEQLEPIHGHWAQQDIGCFSSQVYVDREEKRWFALEMDALVQDTRFLQPSLA